MRLTRYYVLERKTGFEPATLTLAKAVFLVFLGAFTPLTCVDSGRLSADSAESAPLRFRTFNALNLCGPLGAFGGAPRIFVRRPARRTLTSS